MAAPLAWIVGQEELLPVFLGASGLSETDLRTRVSDSDLLGAVLDFVMMDDAWVMSFCDGCPVRQGRHPV